MMNVANWNWAVWVVLAMYGLALLLSANQHGKPRGPADFWSSAIGAVIGIWLLWCGGFFS